ncbi:MarR family transcriptional regulator [Variovorax sp. NFACC27]|jgi:DNA-binding MarR family transcriptional regulator|uniref:MarR family winged helix-turn-helix transcriptional regulator n=1 Tax=unclassified Variovorax TaxID=663243 RepID=UPI00089A4BE0|nr:MarR family transcriptional regulator [Variovorax sp. YR750]MDP9603464.1 DNA-binding MarR family transcriptional regulator [Variovorax paradoxus]SEF28174.1 DNA-binding transcriptional regulator, MarR family [Variovorax sp. NFACC28]SEG76444.1 DNA-binding transcriptional regulator, MarR family [Variovorax sp. NFACC29]SFD00243.1 DNA-binding transcriptional regulator, MarR family [Variovorax sp. NFACC26]SFG12142.1 DNA-binding transcriptional regulator, MarR family [Variovorax sp. NFACC27]
MQAFPDAAALRAPRSLDDLLLYRLSRAVRAGSGMATRLVEGGFGITHREWGMIGMLAQIGEITSSAFAERLQLDRVRTSRGLRSLSEKKLVERRRDADDGREVHVRLSATGRELCDALFPRIARLNMDLLEGIDEEHLDIFLECLRRLELRGRELSAMGIVQEKADRRSGGTRHRWR